jgi:hypothetical protein
MPRDMWAQPGKFRRGDDRPVFHLRGGGQRPYEPNDQARKRVRSLAMLGVPQDKTAQDVGIDPKTLRKYFKAELDQGAVEAYAQVAGRLFKKAMEGDTIAMIFWMKARCGWVDRQVVNHNHTHNVGMSHEERLALLERDPAADSLRQEDEDPPEVVDGEAVEVPEDGGEAQAYADDVIVDDPYARVAAEEGR